MRISDAIVAWIGAAWSAHAAPWDSSTTVTVDLGYFSQQGAIEKTDSGFRYLNFTNIRYAAPPTGVNRFRPPVSPGENGTVQTAGDFSIMCPQAQPKWIDFSGGSVGNLTQVPLLTAAELAAAAPGSSEDCLFLDIIVPETVFNNRNTKKAPVVVFVHGGGYVESHKTASGSGIGLVQTAGGDGNDLVYVAINYRLGLFGFLADGHLSEASEVIPNLGLMDQKYAFEWVEKYIHLFGGDSSEVTIMGESAGAGSILYHLTSPDLSGRMPFKRAITQSTFAIDITPKQQRATFESALRTSNVTSFNELKFLSTEELQIVNGLLVGNAAPFGTFLFGPVTDGQHYPKYPPISIANGEYDRSVLLMLAHNANEGILFASPFVRNDSEFNSYITNLLPEISASALDNLTRDLYPSDWSGTQGYADELGRIQQLVADYLILCNTYLLQRTTPSSDTLSYVFSVPPAWHSGDLAYTFMDPDQPGGMNVTLGHLFQQYLTSFVVTGYAGLSSTMLDNNSTGDVRNFDENGFGIMETDMISPDRCDWWSQGLFLPQYPGRRAST